MASLVSRHFPSSFFRGLAIGPTPPRLTVLYMDSSDDNSDFLDSLVWETGVFERFKFTGPVTKIYSQNFPRNSVPSLEDGDKTVKISTTSL